MNERKEVLSFMIYMWNKWSINECAVIFNGADNTKDQTWCWSLGEHIWDKWREYNHSVERFVANIDENCLNKIVERACSLYCGRKNK
jgi:hypothetical protein